MLDIDCFAERISKLTPQEKQQLAGLLAGDRTLVDAIVRRSPAKQQIDMLMDVLHRIARVPLAKILREELAYRKRKRDRKSDPETIRRNVEICDAFHKEGNKK